MRPPEFPTSQWSALRYSLDHDRVLGDKNSRHRILIDLAAQGKRALELGCADGYISRHLAERGCRVTGIEVDAEAAQRAQQWCERVLNHDLNDPGWIQQLEGKFDTIVCGDVLEHLIEPERTLRLLHQLLAPGGRVIICLPNIAHIRVRMMLLRGHFDYEPTGIMDATHLRFYTYDSAREMIGRCGYRIAAYHPMVGGGAATRWPRVLLHKLFAGSMMFVAVPATNQAVTSESLPSRKD